MTFKPGISGNPSGRAADQPWRDALRATMSMPRGKDKRSRLLAMAEVVWQKALDGDMEAVREISNRFDGKPIETQRIEGDGVRYVVFVPIKAADETQWESDQQQQLIDMTPANVQPAD